MNAVVFFRDGRRRDDSPATLPIVNMRLLQLELRNIFLRLKPSFEKNVSCTLMLISFNQASDHESDDRE